MNNSSSMAETRPRAEASTPATAFIRSVLDLNPRLAAFDCDGTLWPMDSGDLFMRWEIARGLLDPKTGEWLLRWNDEYLAGRKTEEECCAVMTSVHAGMEDDYLKAQSRLFFVENVAQHIFPEMDSLLRRLQQEGCEIWLVSSTHQWLIAEAASHFAIPSARVLATCVEVTDGLATDRLLRVPTGEGKRKALLDLCPVPVDVAFGNSRHDMAMLESARHALVVNPTPELEVAARARGWPIHQPSR